MKQAHSAFPRGVIDVVAYHDELSIIRDWLESEPDKTPQIAFLEEAGVQLAPFRDAERIAPRRSKNSERMAVAAGQYLLWCSAQPCASSVASARDTQCYYGLFALYWSLLKRRLKVNCAMAADLIKIERLAGVPQNFGTH